MLDLAAVLRLETERRIKALSTFRQTFQKRDQVNPRNVLRKFVSEPSAAFRHGSVYAYERHKCRCAPCRAAKAAYTKRYVTPVVQTMRNFRVQPSLFQEKGA